MSQSDRTILVCGGRNFWDREAVWSRLDELHGVSAIGLVLHGAAAGADTIAQKWAVSRGVRHRAFPAKWCDYGLSAGPIRNREMLVVGRPDLVVAFPGGAGTDNLVTQARERGVPVWCVGE